MVGQSHPSGCPKLEHSWGACSQPHGPTSAGGTSYPPRTWTSSPRGLGSSLQNPLVTSENASSLSLAREVAGAILKPRAQAQASCPIVASATASIGHLRGRAAGSAIRVGQTLLDSAWGLQAGRERACDPALAWSSVLSPSPSSSLPGTCSARRWSTPQC